MIFLSLARREASVACKKRRLYYIRIAMAAAMLIILAGFTLAPRVIGSGSEMFQQISLVSFIYCIVAGAIRSFDTLSEEKREGTLGLLFLTDLSPTSVL